MTGFIIFLILGLAAFAFGGLYFSTRKKLKAARVAIKERDILINEIQASHAKAAEREKKISSGTAAENVAASIDVLSEISKRGKK